ncbi:hypothetical protein SAMN02910292_01483 [Lachnospiraceae bacterium XBB2008]|nr:hypothetical protein SAMN02910292_01483 [Lachnospiraceae bacterium XBB2008]
MVYHLSCRFFIGITDREEVFAGMTLEDAVRKAEAEFDSPY